MEQAATPLEHRPNPVFFKHDTTIDGTTHKAGSYKLLPAYQARLAASENPGRMYNLTKKLLAQVISANPVPWLPRPGAVRG